MKNIKMLIINTSIILSSISIAFLLIEFCMRNISTFQHGAKREPNIITDNTFIKPPGVKRIVVIGDSFTFGDGVRKEETYPYKLEKKLNKNFDERFEVLNLGIMGINTDQEANILINGGRYLPKGALSFSPDIIIFTFYVNDIELIPETNPRPKTVFMPENVHAKLIKYSTLYRFLHMKGNQLISATGFQESYEEHLRDIYENETEEWHFFKQLLGLIFNYTKTKNTNMLFVIFPSLDKLDNTHAFLGLYDKVSAIALKHNVEILNLFPYFEGKDAANLKVSLMNGHPNGKAYEIASEAIYQYIADNNMLGN